jgi:hypothetical protein
MAVHRRAYRPYEGPLTPERWRLLVLPRYSFMELFQSQVLLAFFVLCFVPFLVELAVVYVTNSAPARALLGITSRPDLIGGEFFHLALGIQSTLAFLLTAWVAPVLVSPDLVNGALPLYLSRPFCVQASLAGSDWLWQNLRLSWATFLGASLWIVVLTLLGLALSACIRWRLVASAAVVATFFVGTAFGEMWREVLRNPWGRLANLSYLVSVVWRALFGLPSQRPVAREMFEERRLGDVPAWAACAALAAACALFVWLLNKRLRAREVVS